VEPEHRLVARTLERQWEEKLAAQQHLEEASHRALREQPRTLTGAEQAAIRRLAADVPALWAAPTTTDGDRKELLRQVVERVVVAARGRSEQVDVTVAWAGGDESRGVVRRPVQQTARLSFYPQLCAQVRAWTLEGLSPTRIAERLDALGYRPARGARFGRQAVRDLRQRLGLGGARRRPPSRAELGTHEWWQTDLAHALGIPKGTLEHWVSKGWARARQEPRGLRRWIVWADAAELQRLREFRQRSVDEAIRRRWHQRPEVNHAPAD
jgi:hypothetical protein